MNKSFLVIIVLVFGIFATQLKAQKYNDDDVSKLYASTKQVNQFIRKKI